MRICAITNVFNERFNLPIWLKYYGGQVGIENCIVVDDTSNDGSTDTLGRAGIIRLPNTQFDDVRRANILSDLANAMLRTYDCVIYSDCDEIVVADPRKFSSLTMFCELLRAPCSTGIGLNVVHHIASEAPITEHTGILEQRSCVQFVSPMCKPLLAKERIAWGGGFHSSNYPIDFRGLYVFHLRWVDIGECLRRLALTRELNFKNPTDGAHQRFSNEVYIKRFLEFSQMQIDEESTFLFEEFTNRLVLEQKTLVNGKIGFGADVRSSKLHRIPPDFRRLF